MTNQQIKEGFNRILVNISDPDTIARLEVAREYFSNPEFKRNLQDFLWEKSNAA